MLKNCPICDQELVLEKHISSGHYSCLNKVLFYKHNLSRHHFEINYIQGKPFLETIIVYPFKIESYENECSNIYVYDGAMARFIVEVPYLNLPWKEEEKVINKLRIYTTMS